MKKIIIVFICLYVYQTKAQDYGSSLGINLGYAEGGIGIMADYNYYANRFNNSSINIAAFMSFDNYTYMELDIPYSLYALQLGYTQQIWEVFRGRTRTLRAGLLLGGQIGYELVNNGKTMLKDDIRIRQESQLIYGPYLGLEIDYNLGNQISLILHGHENYHFNSDVGNLTPYIGLGLRFYNGY
jgi:hypothetical protein